MSILSKTRSIFLTILFTLVIIVSMVGAFILIRFPLSNIYYHNKYLKEKNRHNITAYEYSGKPGRIYSPLKLKDKKISDILNKKNISIISGIFQTSFVYVHNDLCISRYDLDWVQDGGVAILVLLGRERANHSAW